MQLGLEVLPQSRAAKRKQKRGAIVLAAGGNSKLAEESIVLVEKQMLYLQSVTLDGKPSYETGQEAYIRSQRIDKAATEAHNARQFQMERLSTKMATHIMAFDAFCKALGVAKILSTVLTSKCVDVLSTFDAFVEHVKDPEPPQDCPFHINGIDICAAIIAHSFVNLRLKGWLDAIINGIIEIMCNGHLVQDNSQIQGGGGNGMHLVMRSCSQTTCKTPWRICLVTPWATACPNASTTTRLRFCLGPSH